MTQYFFFQADILGYESEPFEYAYEAKDVILYNLGIGASLCQSNGLDLLYEGSEKFGALASFGVIPGFACTSALITGQVPGLPIDLSHVSNYISNMVIMRAKSSMTKIVNFALSYKFF